MRHLPPVCSPLRRCQAEYRASLALSPQANLHSNIGSLLRAKGDSEGAAAAFRRALEMDPAHAKAAEGLAAVTA